MNLDNLEQTLEELEQEAFKIRKAKMRIEVINKTLLILEKDLVMHKAKMKKEHEDVVKLEKMVSLPLFRLVLGDKKEQLEKERQEYLQAVLEYNSIAHEIEILQYEKEILYPQTADEEEIQIQLQYYIKVKEQKLVYNKDAKASQIKKFNAELERLRLFKRELKEAEEVAMKLTRMINRANENLKKVTNFEYKKMTGKGGTNSLKKRNFLDKAILEATNINIVINQLDKELSDIYSQYVFFNIYKYQNFIESFYDHLITDWVTQNNLKNALHSLDSAKSQLKRILDTIRNDLLKADEKLEIIQEEKRDYIMS